LDKQEPYIGMPIILASFDEDRARQNREQKMQPPVSVVSAVSAVSAAASASAASCDTVCSPVETRQPMALAMAYVPWQRWQKTYPLEEGFHHGTIFPELDLPFEGKRKGGMHR